MRSPISIGGVANRSNFQGGIFSDGVDRLGGVFDDEQPVSIGQGQDGVHVAGDAGVVDGHDRLHPRPGGQRLQPGRVQIGIAGTAVRENDVGALPHEGQG